MNPATRRACDVSTVLLALVFSACGGGGGDPPPTVTAPAPVPAAPPPQGPAIHSFAASAAGVTRDEEVTLTAEFEGGVGTVTPGIGTVTSGVPVHVNPTGDTTFLLTVNGPDGSFVTETALVREFDHVVRSTADDGRPGSLRYAMLEAMARGGGEIGIAVEAIVLEAPLPNVDASLAIAGLTGEEVIDGANAHRLFFVAGRTLELTDLVLRRGRAQGGDGGDTQYGGGGGGAAGLGGAVFVDDGVAVLRRVRCESNSAQGGAGGDSADLGTDGGGGGGGLDGEGRAPKNDAGGPGGGGGPLGGLGGAPSQPGGEGAGGGGSNSSGTAAGAGGYGGGGGGGGARTNSGAMVGTRGGAGGFGAGGGGGGFEADGGAGGFGGGSGARGTWTPATGYLFGGGGGGAGLGGAIFVRAGFLQLEDVTFIDSGAFGGRGGVDVVAVKDGEKVHETGSPGIGGGAAVFVSLGAVAFGARVSFVANVTNLDPNAPDTPDDDVFGLLDLD